MVYLVIARVRMVYFVTVGVKVVYLVIAGVRMVYFVTVGVKVVYLVIAGVRMVYFVTMGEDAPRCSPGVRMVHLVAAWA